MRNTKGQFGRDLLSAVVLCWGALGLLCSLQVMLPAQTFALWRLTVLAKESSLLVAAFALLGTVLVALVRSIGEVGAVTVDQGVADDSRTRFLETQAGRRVDEVHALDLSGGASVDRGCPPVRTEG